MNDERRSQPRYESAQLQLVAHNALGGELIGGVSNVSERGMMISANTLLDVDGILQLQLSKVESPDQPILDLALRITWVSAAKTPGSCWAGGEIMSISEQHAKVLHALLEEAQEA